MTVRRSLVFAGKSTRGVTAVSCSRSSLEGNFLGPAVWVGAPAQADPVAENGGDREAPYYQGRAASPLHDQRPQPHHRKIGNEFADPPGSVRAALFTFGGILVDGGVRSDFFVSHAGADRAWAEWVAWQDHWGGDNFIRVGGMDDSEPDMYVSRSTAEGLVPASNADLDFIAHARQDLPLLLTEVRRLRANAACIREWR